MNQKKFVGLDVHKETTAIVVIDELGSVLMQSIVATEATVIGAPLKGLNGEVYITFEVGTQSNWLFHQTKSLVKKVIVCNPRHNKLLQVGNKADLADAKKLAELLRLGSLKEVWQHSPAQAHLKQLVRTYENLKSDCNKVMNRVKAGYRSQAIGCSGSQVYQPSNRDFWLAKLSEPGIRFRTETLLIELETLIDLRKRAKKRMLEEARRHPDFQRLSQIPGLGPINVSRLLAQVGTPFRFQTKRQFWKYCGFAIKTHSSSDHEIINGQIRKRVRQTHTRGLNKHFCRRLKDVFKTAALSAAYREPFCHYYEHLIKTGTRAALAQVSLARKIAATTLSIWKNQTQFDEQRVAAPS